GSGSQVMSAITLSSITIENLRGYYNARLTLDRPRTMLVGPNNAGKTSILRLLNWVVNEIDEAIAFQRRPMSLAEQQLLLPARDARHKARRLILSVRMSDARSWSKFACTREGIADLRVNIRL